MNEAGSAAAVRNQANGYPVALAFLSGVEQGIVAEQPIAQLYFQMRARAEGR